jgi:dihydroorotate dehydrogenase electron transfer subunit
VSVRGYFIWKRGLILLAKLCRQEVITPKDRLLTFYCPDIARKARPGQFVEVRVTEGTDPYLRRPISIFDAQGDEFSLLVRVIGRGTKMMCDWSVGHETDIIGPIGNGFQIVSSDRTVLLAGGGIGIAPLHFLAGKLAQADIEMKLLFSPKRDQAMLSCFKAAIENRQIAENRHELPGLLNQMLVHKPGRIFACGPDGFLKLIAETGRKLAIPVQVSVEQRMACGLGICLGCAVPLRQGDGIVYKRACHDGPVFDGSEVVWDE